MNARRAAKVSPTLSRRIPASSVEADLLRDRIERLWPKSPSTVSPEASVGEVLKKMVDERIGCVMIVDRGKLVGIFSERDALMKLNVDAPSSCSDRSRSS